MIMLGKSKITDIDKLMPVIIDVIKKGKKAKFFVTGNSMYPLFRSRKDTVTLVLAEDIKKYDILLYQRKNDEYVLHRAVKIDDDKLSLVGDGETHIEFPVYRDRVIAKVVEFERGSRYVACNNLFYKIYCRLWYYILPARRLVIFLYIKMRKIFSGENKSAKQKISK